MGTNDDIDFSGVMSKIGDILQVFYQQQLRCDSLFALQSFEGEDQATGVEHAGDNDAEVLIHAAHKLSLIALR